MCCMRLAENTGRKRSPFRHHRMHNFVGLYLRSWGIYRQSERNLLNIDTSSTCRHHQWLLITARMIWILSINFCLISVRFIDLTVLITMAFLMTCMGRQQLPGIATMIDIELVDSCIKKLALKKSLWAGWLVCWTVAVCKSLSCECVAWSVLLYGCSWSRTLQFWWGIHRSFSQRQV